MISGLKFDNMPVNKDSNPLNTDNIRINAAVPIARPTTEIHVMILMTLVDFLLIKYLYAMDELIFMDTKVRIPLCFSPIFFTS